MRGRGGLCSGRLSRWLVGGFVGVLVAWLGGVLACESAPVLTELPAILPGEARGDGLLHVTFFEAGAGAATLVRAPSGQSVLFGSGAPALHAALARRIGEEVQGRLSLYVAFERDPAGLAALQRALSVDAHVSVDGWADRRSPALRAREVLNPGGGAQLTLLGGEAPYGARIEYGAHSFTVMGATPPEGAPLAATTVLLAPNQAAPESIGDEASSRLAPSLVIVSTGPANGLEAPARDVLERLSSKGRTRLLRTDLDGTIRCSSDGSSLRCTPSRTAPGEAPQAFALVAAAGAASVSGAAPPRADALAQENPPTLADAGHTAPPRASTAAIPRARYLSRRGEAHFHMRDCRSVREVPRIRLRSFATRAAAARVLRAAPDCNP